MLGAQPIYRAYNEEHSQSTCPQFATELPQALSKVDKILELFAFPHAIQGLQTKIVDCRRRTSMWRIENTANPQSSNSPWPVFSSS